MDHDDRRAQIGRMIARLVNIKQQRMSSDRAVGDILLNRSRRVLWRTRRLLSGRLRRLIPWHLRANGRSRSEHYNSQEKGTLSHDGD
jgi:hypothetical protein